MAAVGLGDCLQFQFPIHRPPLNRRFLLSNQNMFSFQVLFLILACLWVTVAAATNTLNQGDKLNSSEYLVSQNGAFALFFYKQDYGGTWEGLDYGYYLAMRYTDVSIDNDPLSVPIWLANRDDPIADDSGILTIDKTGLKIIRDDGNPIQLFSPQSTTTNSSDMKVVLQDSGNLVLQGTNGKNTVLWQSFDHPTHTLLPEMKLGFYGGRSLSLTSWLTESIPASGAWTLKWDPEGERLVVRLRERVLWTSGESFANIRFPLDPLNMNYNFTYVSNVDEYYVSYTLAIDEYTPEERRKNAGLTLLYDGNLPLRNSIILLLNSGTCAGDDTENGCERWEGPKCRKKGDKYQKKIIRTTHKDSVNNTLMGSTNLSIDDCKDICWKDCKCLGVDDGRNLGCVFLSGPYLEGDSDGTLYQVIISSRSRSKSWIWILISIAMALMITVLFAILFYLRRRQQIRMEEKFLHDLMTSDDTSDIRELQTGNNGHNLNIYNAASIISATNGFSPENLLGKGGFGPVFKVSASRSN